MYRNVIIEEIKIRKNSPGLTFFLIINIYFSNNFNWWIIYMTYFKACWDIFSRGNELHFEYFILKG